MSNPSIEMEVKSNQETLKKQKQRRKDKLDIKKLKRITRVSCFR